MTLHSEEALEIIKCHFKEKLMKYEAVQNEWDSSRKNSTDLVSWREDIRKLSVFKNQCWMVNFCPPEDVSSKRNI